MQTNSRRSPRSDSNPVTKNGVLALDGYGVRVTVERGHLAFEDGFGRQRRAGRLSRATSGLKRLVILGHSGSVSLDALRWVHDMGAAFVQLDTDGIVIAATAPPRLNDARLRRAQALAASSPLGIELARRLLREKLAGQARVLRRLAGADEAVASVSIASDALHRASTVGELRILEAAAAAAYWGVWSSLPVPFARQDARRVPEHWLSFGTRSSPLTGSPRKAINPPNAILNYLYALLEAETVIAIRTVGLDPGMGVLHADQRGRDSLALDVMEAVRPRADEILLDLLTSRVFAAREFFETRSGDCRLVAPLPRQLAEFGSALMAPLGALVEDLARQLGATPPTGPGPAREGRFMKLPTPLTQENRSSGRVAVRRGPPAKATTRVRLSAGRCGECGDETEVGRRLCDSCLQQHDVEKLALLSRAGVARLAEMRARGADPTATPEARGRMRQRRVEQLEADRRWEEANPNMPARDVFENEVLPGLENVPLRAMEAATGLSKRQCSRIRRGEHTPHPRHWLALCQLTSLTR